MKTKVAACFLAALASCASSRGAEPAGREIAFSESQILNALAKASPQIKNIGGLLSISLAGTPKITLGIPKNRLGISARVNIVLFDNKQPIPVDITGTAGIRYDDTAKAFFLENPVADSVESAYLPKGLEPSARNRANILMASYFSSKPVYVLRENGNPQEMAARRSLRSIRIEPGKVLATLADF